ncbi:GNAT family N-acetyltransferase [Melissococcus plutonius]|uniref:Acetyltransferase n=1 Tax=Melissococcus plutonius (strain ATCC 35311 / DSM 29964 / CIP 104052 / LMG 20360 / NCIMB 702443) TaxID=940190 RepID=F3YBR7_MELPT|nr:acetyltransferase [Melissococcus plutonius]AIM25913.1 putative acetyltransferase [Melissococcus plutonius S1]KMT23904.1 putative acetyltransferase [Melissococcus plutonius]KMT24427.1 putative acetyltransferase [Melissococcus plutonius]KMT26000.1 putative acetyltransferase [Melissococcus plutonius]KMT28550.1 putative acetyltransferase [Melissococcus plutonius]
MSINEKLILLKLENHLINEILRCKNGFLTIINGDIDESSMLSEFDHIQDWLQNLSLLEDKDTLSNKNLIQKNNMYLLTRKVIRQIVGMSNLRYELNDYLFNYDGHIGYSIALSERKQDYGRKLLLNVTLKEAFKHNNEEVLITCDKN